VEDDESGELGGRCDDQVGDRGCTALAAVGEEQLDLDGTVLDRSGIAGVRCSMGIAERGGRRRNSVREMPSQRDLASSALATSSGTPRASSGGASRDARFLITCQPSPGRSLVTARERPLTH